MTKAELIAAMDAAPAWTYIAFGIKSSPNYRRTYIKIGGLWEWFWCENEVSTAEDLLDWALSGEGPDPMHYIGMSTNKWDLVAEDVKSGLDTTTSYL